MFEFLDQSVEHVKPGKESTAGKAVVFPVHQSDVIKLSEKLGYSLPTQLMAFYTEIGYGFFRPTNMALASGVNRLCHPNDIVGMFDASYDGVAADFLIEPETLPFFEVDVDLYLCLKPKSENPNAVWWMWGELQPNQGKICDSLVEFFQKLVVDPNWFNPPSTKF